MMPFSAVGLLLANVVPLLGVIFWGWDEVLVLAVFWIENLLIGFFNIMKMAASSLVARRPSGLFLITFFLIHYGAFCSIHGILLTDLLGFEVTTPGFLAELSLGPGELFIRAAVIVHSFLIELAPHIWLGIAALFLSHLVSFIENYLLNGEVFRARANDLMAKPYTQIIVMHAGLLLGAVVLQQFGSPVWMLALIVFLKVLADYAQFRQRRAKASRIAEQVKDF